MSEKRNTRQLVRPGAIAPKKQETTEEITNKALEERRSVTDEEANIIESEQEQKTTQLLQVVKNSFLGKILYEQDENGNYIPGDYLVDKETLVRQFIPDPKSHNHKEVETITDVSFDGNNVYIQDNEYGRYRLNDPERDQRIKQGLPPLHVKEEDVVQLGRNVANRMDRVWNPAEPIMDVEIGHLRSNFMDKKVAPYGVTMAIRVSRASLALRNLEAMATTEVVKLLEAFIKSDFNMLISGATGTGKTEFQKYLIQFIPQEKKITLMEDTLDSHIKLIYPDKDISSWATVKRGENALISNIGFQELIRAGLRNNPDWLMISEVRGPEAADLLSAALTSHSIMTTLHASGAANIPSRVTDMVSQANANTNYQALQRNIVSVLNLGVQLERKQDPETGKSVRYIKEIYEYVDYDDEKGIIGHPLYEVKETYDEETKEYRTEKLSYRMSDRMIQRLKDSHQLDIVPSEFKDGEYPFRDPEEI